MATQEPVPTGNTYDKYASTNPIEQRMMRGFFAAFDSMLDAASASVTPRRILEIGVGEGIVTSRVIERFPAARRGERFACEAEIVRADVAVGA